MAACRAVLASNGVAGFQNVETSPDRSPSAFSAVARYSVRDRARAASADKCPGRRDGIHQHAFADQAFASAFA